MMIVKNLKIRLTIGAQPSAEIALLQYTTIDTISYTHISRSTGYAVASSVTAAMLYTGNRLMETQTNACLVAHCASYARDTHAAV